MRVQTKYLWISSLLSSCILLTATAQAADAPTLAPVKKADERSEKRAMMHAKRAEFIIKKMDANGDDKVTKTEHDTFQNLRFKETDANNDGSITVDELENYEKKKRDERRQMMQHMQSSGTEGSLGDMPPPPPHPADGKAPPPPPPAKGMKPPFESAKP